MTPPGNRSHRYADSVDAQPFQPMSIGFGEPALPMLIEGLVGSARVRLDEVAIGLFGP